MYSIIIDSEKIPDSKREFVFKDFKTGVTKTYRINKIVDVIDSIVRDDSDLAAPYPIKINIGGVIKSIDYIDTSKKLKKRDLFFLDYNQRASFMFDGRESTTILYPAIIGRISVNYSLNEYNMSVGIPNSTVFNAIDENKLSLMVDSKDIDRFLAESKHIGLPANVYSSGSLCIPKSGFSSRLFDPNISLDELRMIALSIVYDSEYNNDLTVRDYMISSLIDLSKKTQNDEIELSKHDLSETIKELQNDTDSSEFSILS